MSVKKFSLIFLLLIFALPICAVRAKGVRAEVKKINKLYNKGDYADAATRYDQLLADNPGRAELKFNKADIFYKLEDYGQAGDFYKEVAVDSKDIGLVAKAKYNLGNCYYQQGLKQRDSDLQKAIDGMKSSIESWRGVLDLEKENEKAGRNIEVARLMIKDLIDQQKKQQDPNQPSDSNQPQQGNQSEDPNQQGEQKEQQSEDPNKQGEKKEQEQKAGEPNDPNGQQEKQKQEQKETQEKKSEEEAPDTTAQAILDKEQQQQNEKQKNQPGQWQRVERDW